MITSHFTVQLYGGFRFHMRNAAVTAVQEAQRKMIQLDHVYPDINVDKNKKLSSTVNTVTQPLVAR